MPASAPFSVSSAELVRRFGSWQDRVANDPLFVTHHGRPRLVLLSLPRYEGLVARAAEEASEGGGDSLRLATLVDQLDAGFVGFDAGGRIVAINPAACAYFGVTRDVAIGAPPGPALPELDRSVVRTHVGRTQASGEVASFELPAASYPGQWLRVTVFPYGDGAACLFRNISGDRAARATAAERESLHAALRADERVGIGRLSLRGTFAEVDTGLAALAGFLPEALDQVRLTDILPLGRRIEAAQHVEAVLTGSAARAFETSLLVNHGGERAVRIGIAPLRGDFAIDGATVTVVAL